MFDLDRSGSPYPWRRGGDGADDDSRGGEAQIQESKAFPALNLPFSPEPEPRGATPAPPGAQPPVRPFFNLFGLIPAQIDEVDVTEPSGAPECYSSVPDSPDGTIIALLRTDYCRY